MSAQALTYEHVLELFRQTDERLERDLKKWREESAARFNEDLRKSREEFDLRMKKSQKRFDKQMAELGDRIGNLVESMIEGGVVRLFRKLKYDFTCCSRHVEFANKVLGVEGEIDFFLENGDYA